MDFRGQNNPEQIFWMSLYNFRYRIQVKFILDYRQDLSKVFPLRFGVKTGVKENSKHLMQCKFFNSLDTIETYLANAETFIIMYLSISSTIFYEGRIQPKIFEVQSQTDSLGWRQRAVGKICFEIKLGYPAISLNFR